MPGIADCPRCSARVLIQSLADPAQRLRCPHCSGVFAVSDCSSSIVETPPIAVVIDEIEPAAAGEIVTLADSPDTGSVVVSAPSVAAKHRNRLAGGSEA